MVKCHKCGFDWPMAFRTVVVNGYMLVSCKRCGEYAFYENNTHIQEEVEGGYEEENDHGMHLVRTNPE